MSHRLKFGPRIFGSFGDEPPAVPADPAAAAAAPLPDVDVSVGVKAVRKTAPGVVDMDIAFTFPAFNPAESNPIVEVHAISYPAGSTLPTTPAVALASAQPSGTGTPPTSLQSGGDLLVTVAGAILGHQTILTVLGYDDPTPTAPTPTPPPTPEPTAEPTSSPAEETSTPTPSTAEPVPATESATVAEPAPAAPPAEAVPVEPPSLA